MRRNANAAVWKLWQRSWKLCVIGNEGDGPKHYYYAVYEYQYNGVTYNNESKAGTNGCPKIGKLRTIYLNPENPEEYIEKRFLTYSKILNSLS